MIYQKSSTRLAFLFSLIFASLVASVPQQPPFPPGPLGVPFAAGNTSSLSPTGSARIPIVSGSSTSNALMCQVENNGLGPVDGGPPNPDIYSTACSCSQLYSAHASTLTSTFQNRIGPVTETLTTFTDTSFQPPENCCIKCWISARGVQIIYWPITTAALMRENATSGCNGWNSSSTIFGRPTITSAPTSYTLVQDGFIYTSPSVYVAYHDLQAYAICPSFGNTYPRGRTYNTTIAYMPERLSTSICTTGSQGIQPVGYGHFAAINFTEYQYSTSAWSQCAKKIEAGSGGSLSIEGPFYSIPHDVSLIDPAWSTCSAVFNGVFDPPRVLDPGSAMLTGHDSGPPVATLTAAPGPGVHKPAPLLVPATPKPPSAGPAKSDPGNSSPAKEEHSVILPSTKAPNLPMPSPPPNPVVMHTAPPAAAVTAHGVTVARLPARTHSSGVNTAGAGRPSGVVIAGNTYTNGASLILPGPNGVPLSVASDHVLLAGSSYALPPASSPSPLLIAGNPISRAPNGGIAIGTAIVNPDTPSTTAYGYAISIDHFSAIIDGSAYALPPANPFDTQGPANLAITLGNGQILTAGGAPAIVSGTTVALASNGASLMINGHSFSIPPANPSGIPSSQEPVLTVGGQTFTAAPSGFVVDGHTINPGAGAITVGGTRLSLGPNGELVIGSATTTLPSATGGPGRPLITIGGQTFLAASAGFAIGSQTVAPGGTPVTIDGTVVTLGLSGKLVIGYQTTELPSGGGGVQETIGGVVVDAPSPTSSSTVGIGGNSRGSTGSGERVRSCLSNCILVAMAGMLIM